MWRRLRLKQQLRNHAPLRKHQQNEASESSSRPAVKNFAMGWRLKVKNSMMGFLQSWVYWVRIPRTKQRKFGWNQERLMSYGICHFLFGCLFFPGFPGLCVLLLASLSGSSCCSESEDSEIPICEFKPATACVLSRVFSSFWVHLRTWCTAHCP